MGGMQARALRNGAVAAVVTAVVGFAVNALVSSDATPSRAEGGPSVTASPSPACQPTSSRLDRAALSGMTGRFEDVWFDAPARAWAVGSEGEDETSTTPVLGEWDGDAWTASAEQTNFGTAALLGIDGSDGSNVWAVGWSTDGFGRDALVAHFDGASWQSDSPATDAELSDVRVLAEDDVWAVGSLGNPDLVDERATAMHWDGSSWTQVPLPAGGGRSGLRSIAGSSDDLWAAGYHHLGALLLHYDGASWTRVDVAKRARPLNAVATAGETVWAAGGGVYAGSGRSFDAVADAPKGGSFEDVVAASPRSAVAVGSVDKGQRTHAFAMSIAPTATRPVPLRAPGDDALTTVAIVRKDVWTAGWHDTPKASAPLVATLSACL